MANDAGPGPQLLPDIWKYIYYPPEGKDYSYFAHAAKYPFLAASVPEAQRYLVKAAWAADAAMLAYGRCGEAPMPPDKFNAYFTQAGFSKPELIGDWTPDAKGTQGYFATSSNSQFAVLSFRGTERKDPTDLLADLNALQSDEPEHAAPAAAPQGPAASIVDRVVQGTKDFLFHTSRVHAGFQRALDQVWTKVDKLLNEFRSSHPQAEIVFTGHSLGAALATLAVNRFQGAGASLYTIGSPRVGNKTFCDSVHRQTGGRVFRFVNHHDLVTHVPIKAPMYQHVEEQGYVIDPSGELSLGNEDASSDLKTLSEFGVEMLSKGKLFDLNSQAPPQLVDHSPGRYCMLLRYHLEHHVAPV
ncbi:MAG: lipase family protein [Acidobacteriia bacterium]|nr:lipase family protein [Terriglobia bacterium]